MQAFDETLIDILETVEFVPLSLRVLWFFVLGAAIGSFLNVCIYRIPEGKSIAGRSQCSKCGKRIPWYQNLPLISWWWLRGKCAQCGQRFAFRYFLIELLSASLFAFLYWWEVVELGQYLEGTVRSRDMLPELYLRYIAHMVLCSLLIVATFIDLDHFQIPDEVTVPGVVFALLWMPFFPVSFMPHWELPMRGAMSVSWLTFTSEIPRQTAQTMVNYPNHYWLILGLAAFAVWWLALYPWIIVGHVWNIRKRRNSKVALAVLRRWLCLFPRARRFFPMLPIMYAIALLGPLWIVAIYWFGGMAWIGLLTSIIGLGISAGILWSIRVVAGFSLQQEALGFGDVTLMAMMGAFLGWQPVLILFFLGVFFGLFLGIIRLVLRGDNMLPYGPSLCLGALATLIVWGAVWEKMALQFEGLGPILAILLPLCLLIMMPLLIIMRALRVRLLGDDEEEESQEDADQPAEESSADAASSASEDERTNPQTAE